jgi:hypothetical protein
MDGQTVWKTLKSSVRTTLFNTAKRLISKVKSMINKLQLLWEFYSDGYKLIRLIMGEKQTSKTRIILMSPIMFPMVMMMAFFIRDMIRNIQAKKPPVKAINNSIDKMMSAILLVCFLIGIHYWLFSK